MTSNTPADHCIPELSGFPSDCLILGNGEIGLNLRWTQEGWIEGYLSKTDAWDEIGRLVKVARFHIHLPFFTSSLSIQQNLYLNPARALLEAKSDHQTYRLEFWMDAEQSLLWIETQFSEPIEVTFEWVPMRPHPLDSQKIHPHSAKGIDGASQNFIISQDQIHSTPSGIGIYHQNSDSIYPYTLNHQSLSPLLEKFPDPLLHHTFGAFIECTVPSTSDHLKVRVSTHSSPVFRISIASGKSNVAPTWFDQWDSLIDIHRGLDLEKSKSVHQKYWAQFWEESRIEIEGPMGGSLVSKGYRFQRYMHACAGRGTYPIKFNGSIFNTEMPVQRDRFSADDRLWGGGYWFQNTRFSYWASLATGDFAFFKPFFEMYFNALDFGKERTQIWEKHEGSIFPETMYFWGSHLGENYGWNRSNAPIHEVQNSYIARHWNGSLEFLAIAFDFYHYTQDDDFLTTRIIPYALEVLLYFHHHFPHDDQGQLRMEPSQALEMYHNTLNPTPDIAGLRTLCTHLLPVLTKINHSSTHFVHQFSNSIPPIPLRKLSNGEAIIAPAEVIHGTSMNLENPELYPIFPFPLYGIERPHLPLAMETFQRRTWQTSGCWRQDAIHAACLGLMETSRCLVHDNAMQPYTHSNPSRFPAFWGSPFDWSPDQDHGGVLMVALQKMLLQVVDDRLLLFPAWPKEWDVKFKLHGPKKTILKGELKEGKLISFEISPPEHSFKITILEPQF